jgi:hypothetical protein
MFYPTKYYIILWIILHGNDLVKIKISFANNALNDRYFK